jgi:hypothetical protein
MGIWVNVFVSVRALGFGKSEGGFAESGVGDGVTGVGDGVTGGGDGVTGVGDVFLDRIYRISGLTGFWGKWREGGILGEVAGGWGLLVRVGGHHAGWEMAFPGWAAFFSDRIAALRFPTGCLRQAVCRRLSPLRFGSLRSAYRISGLTGFEGSVGFAGEVVKVGAIMRGGDGGFFGDFFGGGGKGVRILVVLTRRGVRL